jgi:hypothetical protein
MIEVNARRASRLAAASLLLGSIAFALPAPAGAQTQNIPLPVAEVESRLATQPFTIIDWRGSRAEGDRTQRIAMLFEDSALVIAKWATAPSGGSAFNNEPRYEVAAYVLQKLFLDEPDYVVPPTVMRAFPIEFVQEQIPNVRPTFREAQHAVLVALQYWLLGVTPQGFWDERRAANDDVYGRHIGNFNVLTHLINHKDTNVGNFLISTVPDEPRVFAVDNGLAFASRESDRGTTWGELLVRRLPQHTVERLKQLTREDLESALGVLAEFEIDADGRLIRVPSGPNMASSRGVRRSADRIQLGLTTREIRGVENRLRALLRQVDGGRIKVF